jgi:hypothetical protein
MDLSKEKKLEWSFEYLHICHQSRKASNHSKIDFEKAFDKVDYSAIIVMLRGKGFV